MAGGSGAAGGGRGGGRNADPSRKQVWKLVDGKPQMTFVKIGLSDGSSTQMIEGDLKPGDQLVTEIQGLPVQQRKMGAF